MLDAHPGHSGFHAFLLLRGKDTLAPPTASAPATHPALLLGDSSPRLPSFGRRGVGVRLSGRMVALAHRLGSWLGVVAADTQSVIHLLLGEARMNKCTGVYKHTNIPKHIHTPTSIKKANTHMQDFHPCNAYTSTSMQRRHKNMQNELPTLKQQPRTTLCITF